MIILCIFASLNSKVLISQLNITIMKKYIVIILSAVFITSCSNGLEKQAKEQLKKTMKEMLKNPDSATLTNVKTELNNDSLCIIHFTCKAQNGFGGYSTGNYEYLYLKINDEKEGTCYYKEGVINLGKKFSVIDIAQIFNKSLSNSATKDYRKGKSADDIERDSINNIYHAALKDLVRDGRKVEKDDGEEIKL